MRSCQSGGTLLGAEEDILQSFNSRVRKELLCPYKHPGQRRVYPISDAFRDTYKLWGPRGKYSHCGLRSPLRVGEVRKLAGM